MSVKLDGTDHRKHVGVALGNITANARLSPDGKWLLVLNEENAYLASLAGTNEKSLITSSKPSGVWRLTTEGASSIGWADGGKTITWSFVNEFYRVPLERVTQAPTGADWKAERFVITLTVPRPQPDGVILLRGARIISMKGNEVIERGDILIERNRVKTLGPSGSIKVPPEARVIDVSRKTIIPGLVDVHAHMRTGGDMPPEQVWEMAEYLAFGVTTTRDPNGAYPTVVSGELVAAGELVGPRVYTTDGEIHGAPKISSYDDALHVVRKMKRRGANSLKQYALPTRIQRQWVRMAAEAEEMNSTNEGASDLRADLTMAIDGYTGIEHNLPVVPVYRDVIQLMARSQITYTPTMIVAFGGTFGETYWVGKWDIEGDPKARRFRPSEDIARRWRTVGTRVGASSAPIIEDSTFLPAVARVLRDVVRAGGRIGLGGHGNFEGLGVHWELQMLGWGGLTPHEVLRAATLHSADSIGLAQDLGSLEPGKLADLLVLDGNPLADLAHAKRIRYVVKNGIVYHGETLDEIWPAARRLPRFPWSLEDEDFERLRRAQSPTNGPGRESDTKTRGETRRKVDGAGKATRSH